MSEFHVVWILFVGLSNDDDDGGEKVNPRFFNIDRSYSMSFNVGEFLWSVRVVVIQQIQPPRNVQKRDARAKLLFCWSKPIAFCRSRCLVFVEPPSPRLNKTSHSESFSSVVSDDSEWNFTLFLSLNKNIQQNVQKEVNNYDPTTRENREADDEDVVIPYAEEPLASQQFI